MKLKNLKPNQIKKFLETVHDNCKGKVYLISPDMNINLKSNLSKYISFVNLCLNDSEAINEIEIVAGNREDIDIIYNFMKECTTI